MAPSNTQSPHRFLGGRRRKASPSKEARAPSSLSKEVTTPSRNVIATPQKPSQQARQFAQTPRFSLGRPKALSTASSTPRPKSPPGSGFVEALRAAARPREDVVDDTGGNGDDEMLDVDHHQALPTTELEGVAEEWMNDLPFSPKRRRIEGEDSTVDFPSPAKPTFRPPPPPSTLHSNQPAPHFTTPAPSTQISAQRPAFLRPSVQPQEPTDPVPDVFSPQRRGQKFVPGGLASTVQQWAIETGQAAAQSRRGQGYLRGEEFVFRLKVESLDDGGQLFLVRGKGEDGEILDVLLAGDGGALGREKMKEGCLVGVRAPTWEVEGGERVWTVGVDWRVVS